MSSEKPSKKREILSEQEIENLLNRVATGDHKACEAFYIYFKPQVSMQARKHLRESKVFVDSFTFDGLVNEILYVAINKLSKFRGESVFAAFLSGITRNLCSNFVRRHIRDSERNVFDEALLTAIPDEAPGPEAMQIEKQDHEALHYCLGKLPTKASEIMRATYFGELSEAECAAAFNIPQGTVKSAIFNAKKKLRTCIENWRRGGRHG